MSNEGRARFLKYEKKRLSARLQAIRDDLRRGLDPNLSDQVVVLENRDVLEEIARVTHLELKRVETELRHLESHSVTVD